MKLQDIYYLYEHVHKSKVITIPKIIEDLKARILKEAKRQVFENGYASMTLRSIGKGCHIAVGTIYNYYPSKELLVASFILEDWLPIASDLRAKCKNCENVVEACRTIYDGLLQLETEYKTLFAQDAAIKTASTVFHEQHRRLRKQLAEMLGTSCRQQKTQHLKFLPEFLAESLLAWSSEMRDFDDLEMILCTLIK